VAYRELSAPKPLQSQVACVWWRTGPARRVLPDGCADLVWTGRSLIVAGPATRAHVAEVDAGAVKLGVRFRLGSAGAMLRVPARELRDQAPLLSDVRPGGDELERRVADACDARARLRVLVEAVAQWQRGGDPLVRLAALQLERGTPVSELCRQIGISERQLRRRFDAAVGYSPRTLRRVLRLQRFLRAAAHDDGLAGVAVRAGYADQAHLTRECSELTGLPPARLLATGAGPAGDPLIGA
jgi:AraC-like DNA-binding protein